MENLYNIRSKIQNAFVGYFTHICMKFSMAWNYRTSAIISLKRTFSCTFEIIPLT